METENKDFACICCCVSYKGKVCDPLEFSFILKAPLNLIKEKDTSSDFFEKFYFEIVSALLKCYSVPPELTKAILTNEVFVKYYYLPSLLAYDGENKTKIGSRIIVKIVDLKGELENSKEAFIRNGL